MRIEDILAKYLFLFLKHLSIELNHASLLAKLHQLPSKSILRKIITTQPKHSFPSRQVLFTYIDSVEFDPEESCQFLQPLQRKQFYSSNNGQPFMQCLCHRSPNNVKTTRKIKFKHK